MARPLKIVICLLLCGQIIGRAAVAQSIALDDAYEEYLSSIRVPVEEALKTLSLARCYFESRLDESNVYVAVILRDDNGRWEQVLIRVLQWDDDVISGELASTMTLIEGFPLGSLFVVDSDRVVDWLHVRGDGRVDGNYIPIFLQRINDN